MFCPECESEYREGILHCSDCDVSLVSSLDAPLHLVEEKLTPLTETHDPLLVEALIEKLEAAGVPYVITAGTGLLLLDRPDIALDGPLSWEARIVVSTAMFDRARRVLAELRPNAP